MPNEDEEKEEEDAETKTETEAEVTILCCQQMDCSAQSPHCIQFVLSYQKEEGEEGGEEVEVE